MEVCIETTAHSKTEVPVFYERLYEKCFLKVARFVSKSGGTYEMARDLYHDALVIYYNHLSQPDFTLDTNEEAYVLGIAKNLFYKKIGNDLKSVGISDDRDFPSEEETRLNDMRLYKLIAAAGQKCLDLLTAFYFSGNSMKQLASHFGFNSERSATVQKYKCIEKLRETVKRKQLRHEDFFE